MAATTLSVTDFYDWKFYQNAIYYYSTKFADESSRIAPIARILSLMQRALSPRR